MSITDTYIGGPFLHVFNFLIILALIPICVGITLLVLFNKNKLSKVILLFLLLATLWQLDVAFLYSHELFKEETITFFFKLFRFGPIMVTPTLFYIGYIMVQETLSNDLQKSGDSLLIEQPLLSHMY